jgi:hypothetical protein
LQIIRYFGGVVLSSMRRPSLHSKHWLIAFVTNEYAQLGWEQLMQVADLIMSGNGGLLKQYGQNGYCWFLFTELISNSKSSYSLNLAVKQNVI